MNLFSDRGSTPLISTTFIHESDKINKCTTLANFALLGGAFVFD